MVAAKLLGGFHSALISLVAMRRMEAGEFGAFAFGVVAITVVDGVVGSAVDLGVLKRISESKAEPAAATVEYAGLAGKVLIGSLLLLAAILVGAPLAQAILQRESRFYFPVVAAAVLSLFLFRSQQIYHQGRHENRRFAAIEALQVILRCALVFGYLAASSPSPEVALSLFAVSPPLVLLVSRAWSFGIAPWRHVAIADLQDLGRFVRGSLLATATGAAASRIDIAFVGRLTSPAMLGRYSAAQTLAQIPEIAATYLSNILAPSINPRLRDGTFLTWFRKITAAGAAACLMAAALGIPLMDWAVRGFLPEKAHAAIGLAEVLVAGYLVSALLFPVTLNLLLFHQPATFVRYDLFTVPFLLVGYYWAGVTFGAYGIAWVSVAARVLKTVTMHAIAFRVAGRIQSAAE